METAISHKQAHNSRFQTSGFNALFSVKDVCFHFWHQNVGTGYCHLSSQGSFDSSVNSFFPIELIGRSFLAGLAWALVLRVVCV